MTTEMASTTKSGTSVRVGRRALTRGFAALLGAAAAGTLLAGCGEVRVAGYTFDSGTATAGSGRTVTKSYDLTGFTSVAISDAFKYEVARDNGFTVSVTADDNLVDRLDVRAEGETLYVGLKPGSYHNIRCSAVIKLPTLRSLRLSGAADGTLSYAKAGENLKLDLSGASKIGGHVEVESLKADLGGASRVQLDGKAESLKLSAGGASHAELGGLSAVSANVDLSGASGATTSARDRLDYSLSGASRLNYSGEPRIGRQSTSGASSVNKP